MMEKSDLNRTTTKISIVVSLLVIIVTAVGLVYPLLYQPRQNAMTTYELLGQDIISLLVGFLLLLVGIAKSSALKHREIISTGCLAYLVYVYAYFCFGLVSSVLYLAHALILSLAFFALVLSLFEFTRKPLAVTGHYPRVSIFSFLIFCVVLVGTIEISDIARTTIFKGGSITSKDLYCILDLAFLFPAMAIAAVMNFKNKPMGYALAGVFLVKTITLMPAIILADVMHYIYLHQFVDLSFDMIAVFITLCASILFGLYYKQLVKTI